MTSLLRIKELIVKCSDAKLQHHVQNTRRPHWSIYELIRSKRTKNITYLHLNTEICLNVLFVNEICLNLLFVTEGSTIKLSHWIRNVVWQIFLHPGVLIKIKLLRRLHHLQNTLFRTQTVQYKRLTLVGVCEKIIMVVTVYYLLRVPLLSWSPRYYSLDVICYFRFGFYVSD